MRRVAALLFAAAGLAASTVAVADPVAPTGGSGPSRITAAFTATPLQGANCVAPCAVHFDAALTDADPNHSREFHELLYRWDFGDAAAESKTWWHTAETGLTRNHDRGPIVGHVYDAPGSYTVTLAVTAPDGAAGSARRSVVVADPDTVFAASTWCFSTSAEFSGCPKGGAQVTIGANEFDDALASSCHADTQKSRCLFKGGDDFSSNGTVKLFQSSAPGLVGSFGTGRAKVATTVATQFVLRDGWQITGLAFDCGATDKCGLLTRAVGAAPTFQGIAIVGAGAYDVSMTGAVSTCATGFGSGGGSETNNSKTWFIANTCDKTAESGSAAGGMLFDFGDKTVLIGNELLGNYRRVQQLITRLYVRDSVYAHNHLVSGGAADTATPSKNWYGLLQLRGGAGIADPNLFANKRNVVAYNKLDVRTGPAIAPGKHGLDFIKVCSHHSGCTATNAGGAECDDVILENNFATIDGTPNGGVNQAIITQCSGVTVRNNVFDFQGQGPQTSPASGPQLVAQNRLPIGITPTGYTQIYHNSVYLSSENGGFQTCRNDGNTVTTGTRCESNLVYAPAMAGSFLAPSGTWADTSAGDSTSKTTQPSGWTRSMPGQGATRFSDFLDASIATCNLSGLAPVHAGAQRGCIVH